MSKIADFQKKLLTDDEARKAFAADPAGYLKRHGIELPAGTKAPVHINLAVLERRAHLVNEALQKEGLSASTANFDDASTLSKVEHAGMSAEEIRSARSTASRARAAATVAAIGAVVVAVVAVPVAVYGVEQTPTSGGDLA